MKKLIFGMFMTDQGPKAETNMEKRLLLRTLAAYCEDLREELAVDKAIELLQSDKRVVEASSIPPQSHDAGWNRGR